jgi:hypothetical protein
MTSHTGNVLIHPLHRTSVCQRCGLVGEIYCRQILLCGRCAAEISTPAPAVQTERAEAPKGPSLIDVIESVLKGAQ